MLMCESVGYGGSTDRASNGQDPYRAYVTWLVQPQASDLVPIDDGPAKRAVYTNGALEFGASPWPGYKSLVMPGNVAYAVYSDPSADFIYDGSNYCMEWVGFVGDLTGGLATFSKYQDSTSDYSYLDVINADGSHRAFNYGIAFAEGTKSSDSPAGTIAANNLYACAVVKDATSFRTYVNGALVASTTDTPTRMGGTAAVPPIFGALNSSALQAPFRGRVAAMRMTRHNRGYTGATIPNALTTGPFPVL
ncbi:LamG-like jellyroll fold domain-containing protein [Azospirillum agricola]|uniref:LamG-like jellyroll fold domain-containing protein n=1 Tax=Azospirillum agricola TaxID=1720247 RepID=UPI000A0F36D8|nr:LamG-like jellyroll fold domain-containing protein [Azospirillum agricola]SMH62833.1 Concanavalin A-like lectin/glucanases superfamily protein [Azospirillum lipoferum]